MTPGAIEGGKCASVRDKAKRTLDLIDASFGRGSRREGPIVAACSSAYRRAGVRSRQVHVGLPPNLTGVAALPKTPALCQLAHSCTAAKEHHSITPRPPFQLAWSKVQAYLKAELKHKHLYSSTLFCHFP